MQTYATQTKKKNTRTAVSERSVPVREIPNSAIAASFASDTTELPDPELLSKIKSRSSDVPGRMQAQIPTAEREADSLSSGIGIGLSSPEAVKAEMGQRLGADLSGVSFHTDSKAQVYADSIGARAYTTGSDIYFGEGGFDPSVAAHELVHTAQQGATDAAVPTVAAPMGGVQMWPWSSKKKDKTPKTKGKGKTTAPITAPQSEPKQPKYGSLDEEVKAKYSKVTEIGNSGNFYGKDLTDFLVKGGNRISTGGDVNPIAMARKKRTATLKSYLDKSGFTDVSQENADIISSAFKENGNYGAQNNKTYIDESAKAFGTSSGILSEYLDSDEGIQDLLAQAKAYRGATKGREGAQDVFGNDTTLSKLLLNNMMMYGLTSNMTDAAGTLVDNPAKFSAVGKISQSVISNGNLMFMNPFEGDLSNDNDVAQYTEKLNNLQQTGIKGMPPAFTNDNVKKFLELEQKVKQMISAPQEESTTTTQTPPPQTQTQTTTPPPQTTTQTPPTQTAPRGNSDYTPEELDYKNRLTMMNNSLRRNETDTQGIKDAYTMAGLDKMPKGKMGNKVKMWDRIKSFFGGRK